jgi:uncharacterized protein GlcG (DUF336 family)
MHKKLALTATIAVVLAAVCPLGARPANDHDNDAPSSCNQLPSFNALRAALIAARTQTNGGFNLDMWATVVNRDGVVCAVAFTGNSRGDQWPGSRVISAQKANTANAFSLPALALSTANLFSAVQPGGTLYGLQHSNPVNTDVAYRGDPKNYGQSDDPMVGGKIGGVNVFGGGLALYNAQKQLIGAIGVSGDSSCADHNIAWRTRHTLKLDYVPAGVSGDSTRPDNIVYDITNAPNLGSRRQRQRLGTPGLQHSCHQHLQTTSSDSAVTISSGRRSAVFAPFGRSQILRKSIFHPSHIAPSEAYPVAN